MRQIEGGLRRSYDQIESGGDGDESPNVRKLRLIQQREVLVGKGRLYMLLIWCSAPLFIETS